MSTPPRLVPLTPFKDSICVPEEVYGTPAARAHAEAEVVARLVRRAAGRGLKPGRITRRNVGRLLGGVPRIVIDEIVDDEDLEGRFPATRKKVHLRLAKLYRDEVIRKVTCRTGWACRAKLFVDGKGRPRSLVSYPDRLFDMEAWDAGPRLGAAWGLEPHISLEHIYVSGRGMAAELCLPGHSILAQP